MCFAVAENIVGKGGNAGYKRFLLFPQGFQKVSFSGSPELGFVSEGLIDCIAFFKILHYWKASRSLGGIVCKVLE